MQPDAASSPSTADRATMYADKMARALRKAGAPPYWSKADQETIDAARLAAELYLVERGELRSDGDLGDPS